MDRYVHLILLSITVGATTTAPELAHADPKDEARQHFQRAVELVDRGQLAQGLDEFQKSYDLTQHYAVLYNIAQVLAKLGRPVEAVDAYQRYLTEGRGRVDPARQAQVRSEIARQTARIGLLELTGLPQGARVSIDGKELGTVPSEVRLAAGKHVVVAAADKYQPMEVSVSVAGGERKPLRFDLVRQEQSPTPSQAATAGLPSLPLPPQLAPAAAPSETSLVVATPAKKPREGWWLGRRWTWIAAGGTVLFAAGATTFGLLMRSRFDELSDSCGRASSTRPGCAEDDISSLNTRKHIANVLWGLTGIAAVSTGVLFYLEGRRVTVGPTVGLANGLTATVSF